MIFKIIVIFDINFLNVLFYIVFKIGNNFYKSNIFL